MKEQFTFNVFHQFAGCFVPYGLLALRRLSTGAKICYSLLAQQSNARSVTQLNIPLIATALGEPESNTIRYLQELEQLNLIQSSRGNANAEDIRISFPRHPWLMGHDVPAQSSSLIIGQGEKQPRLFALESTPPPVNAVEETATSKSAPVHTGAPVRSKRRKRRYGRPRSRHTYEDCLGFVTYQKEVQGRWWLYDLERLAEFLYFSGQQDEDVSAYLTEVRDAA